jgi:AcrB/AcrD/AcrF family
MISAIFVDRPRLAVVIAIVITIAGALALLRIPVAQFPDIVPPQTVVSATFPGASAAVVESTIAQPIEAQVVGVDKMIYMSSTSGNDGSYNLTVSFVLGSDPDINTNAVNNRVQTALAQLPPEVQLEGLTIQKKSSAVLQFIMLYSENGKQDPLFITNYAIINVLDVLSRTPGVGQARLFGALNYSMRIWFDTQRLDNLQLTPADVIAAIQAQNVEAPAGRIGARPISRDQQFQMNVQTQGRLTTPEQFGNIVLRAAARAGCRAGRPRRPEPGRRRPPQQRACGRDRHLSLSRRQRRANRCSGRGQFGSLEPALPAGPQISGQLRYDHLCPSYDSRCADHARHRLWAGRDRRLCVSRQSARDPHSCGRGAGQRDRYFRGAVGRGLFGQYDIAARDGAGGRHPGR